MIYLISFAYDYRLDDTADTPMSVADRLIRAGDMPPAILVAPDDTVGFGYHAALALDLVPYVDHKYNTIPERKYRGVAGISHGGAIAARMAIQFPEEFGSLGVLSGGIATGETDTFEGWIASAPSDSRPRIRIDLGDQDIGILPLTQNLTKVLDHNNISYTLNMGHGGHSDFFWSPLMEPYLLWFAAAWK